MKAYKKLFEQFEIQGYINECAWTGLANGCFGSEDEARVSMLDRQSRNHIPMRIVRRLHEVVETIEPEREG